MNLLIDRTNYMIVAAASKSSHMALIAKHCFPGIAQLIVSTEDGRGWTELTSEEMQTLYKNISHMDAPDFGTAIDHLRIYGRQWTDYPTTLEELEKRDAMLAFAGPLDGFHEVSEIVSTTAEADAELEYGVHAASAPHEKISPVETFQSTWYWIHPESSCAGILHSIAEAQALLAADPRVELVSSDDYDSFLVGLAEASDVPYIVETEEPEPDEPISQSTVQAIITGVEAANSAAKGSNPDSAAPSAPKAPKASSEAKAPSKPGATKRVWEIADSKYAIQVPTPENIKLFRKAVVDACEAEGINPGTAATQFGKWKATKGL